MIVCVCACVHVCCVCVCVCACLLCVCVCVQCVCVCAVCVCMQCMCMCAVCVCVCVRVCSVCVVVACVQCVQCVQCVICIFFYVSAAYYLWVILLQDNITKLCCFYSNVRCCSSKVHLEEILKHRRWTLNGLKKKMMDAMLSDWGWFMIRLKVQNTLVKHFRKWFYWKATCQLTNNTLQFWFCLESDSPWQTLNVELYLKKNKTICSTGIS